MGESLPKGLNELVLEQQFALEDVLDRRALPEFTRSVEALFGVSVRILTSAGTILADAGELPSLYRLYQKSKSGRLRLNQTISRVLAARPELGRITTVPCVSGATYFISAIAHDGHILGRIVVGPLFVADEPSTSPQELDVPEILEPELLEALEAIPRRSAADCENILQHLGHTLDVLLYSGFKAHLASSMHLSSVRESFRELSEKNAKLQLAYDRLRELDRLKSNFLATVSHELRTPLTSIIGYSEMLKEGIPGELNEEQAEFVTTIHQKGEQLLELIQSLLDLSKLESGTMSLKKKDVDCGALARDVALTLTPTARKKQVELTTEVEANLPAFFGDGERLRQVLLNLIENAIKFTARDGKVHLMVRLAKEASDQAEGGGVVLGTLRRTVLEFMVVDTGIGIPDEQRERVFDAFYQVDNSATREIGGSGLGLSIVKRLVDAHDGQIYIEPNQPTGTRFIVRLPLRRTS